MDNLRRICRGVIALSTLAEALFAGAFGLLLIYVSICLYQAFGTGPFSLFICALVGFWGLQCLSKAAQLYNSVFTSTRQEQQQQMMLQGHSSSDHQARAHRQADR